MRIGWPYVPSIGTAAANKGVRSPYPSSAAILVCYLSAVSAWASLVTSLSLSSLQHGHRIAHNSRSAGKLNVRFCRESIKPRVWCSSGFQKQHSVLWLLQPEGEKGVQLDSGRLCPTGTAFKEDAGGAGASENNGFLPPNKVLLFCLPLI